MCYTYTTEYYLTIKKNAILPFSTTWTGPQYNVRWCQSEKDNIIQFHSYVEFKKENKEKREKPRKRLLAIKKKLTVTREEVGVGDGWNKWIVHWTWWAITNLWNFWMTMLYSILTLHCLFTILVLFFLKRKENSEMWPQIC